MRTTFAKTITHIAKRNKNVMLLTGDLGYSVFEDFQNQNPRQYLNMGVAEQNMAGVAAGLAMEGRVPIIYSIVPFTTMRNFEQIRNDICYQNLNVKIVGVGAGFSYGPYGHTHHGLEDIGILRTIPNLVILTPGDPVEVALATRAMMRYTGPVYMRLGKAGEPIIHKKKPVFVMGKGFLMRDGRDVTVIATSTMLERAIQVADQLGSTRVISMPTIKPLDTKIIIDSLKKTKAIVTLEEHSIVGGLGSAVSEVIAESGIKTIFKRIGVSDNFTKAIGLQEYMRRVNGLSVDQIVHTIKKLLT
jgi:transketolase